MATGQQQPAAMQPTQPPVIVISQPQAYPPQQSGGSVAPLIIGGMAVAGVAGYYAYTHGYLDWLKNILGPGGGTPPVQCPDGYTYDPTTNTCVPTGGGAGGCTSDDECPGDLVCVDGVCKTAGAVPGTPKIISFDVTSSIPGDTITWNYTKTIPLLSTISGIYTLVDECPNCAFKYKVGVSLYAMMEDGTTALLFSDRGSPGGVFHPGGRSAGTYSFTAAPGLTNVQTIFLAIDSKYGKGNNHISIQRIAGTALVVM